MVSGEKKGKNRGGGRRPVFKHPDAAKVCAQAGHHLCLLWPMKLWGALLGMLNCWWECVGSEVLLWPGRSLANDMIKDEWESREEGGGRRGPPYIGQPLTLASLVVKKHKSKSKLLIIISSMVHIPWLSNFSFFCNLQVFIFQDFLSVPFTNSQKPKIKNLLSMFLLFATRCQSVAGAGGRWSHCSGVSLPSDLDLFIFGAVWQRLPLVSYLAAVMRRFITAPSSWRIWRSH